MYFKRPFHYIFNIGNNSDPVRLFFWRPAHIVTAWFQKNAIVGLKKQKENFTF